MSSTKRRKSRAKIVEAILDAAAREFALNGLRGATMTRIAAAAGIPKPNVNYYFKTKEVLYRRVLHRVQDIWSAELDLFQPEADPVDTIDRYIRAKLDLARRYPIESRVFANEMIRGAPYIGGYLRTDYNRRIENVWRTFESWLAAGLIDPIDPKHLMLMLWAATQTYADHAPQVAALLGRERIPDRDFEAAASQLSQIVLQGIRATSWAPGQRPRTAGVVSLDERASRAD